jgi:hypothetical protein
MARIFGGVVLIAAEEARSSTGGQHAKVLARADALNARPRPALCGWRRRQFLCGAHMHENPAKCEDNT